MRPVWRLATSTFLLTIIFLLGFDLSLAAVNPLKRLNDFGLSGLNYYYVVAKLPQFFASSKKADVALTGSSCWLYSSVRTEDAAAGIRTRYDAAYVRERIDGCSTSSYFQSLLKGKPTVVNLATAAGLMSDQYFVLKKLVATSKQPQLLICDLSPREFLDNNYPDPTQTPVHVVLSDLSGMDDILSLSKNFPATCDYLFGAVSNCFRSRRDLRLVLVNFAAEVAGKKVDLASITHPSVVPVYANQVDVQKDLDHYKKMYLPVNHRILDTQLDYFQKYLELAKQAEIPVLCVWMPLSDANLALLPKKELDDLRKRADAVATEYGASVCRPATQYAPADFEDSAHLNESGGKKFFAALAEQANLLLAPKK